jgi:hypothetical protein
VSDGARSLDEIRALIVRGLRPERREVERAIWGRIRDAVPAAGDSGTPEYETGQLEAISAIVSCSLDAIARGPEWSGPIPGPAALQARRAARLGVSLGTVQRRYFAGHRELGEFVTRELDRSGFSNDGEVIHHLRRTQEALLEHVTAAIEREYEHEHELLTGSRRSETVQRLLAGERVDELDLAALDYDIRASFHVGIVASGADVGEMVSRLKGTYPRKSLSVHLDGRACLWLGVKAVDVRHLSLDGADDITLAVGEAGTGLDGWRLTYNQARAAFAVAALKAEKIAWYADHRLLAAALENETLARSLTQKYLVPLSGKSDGGVKLRRTLRIYIELQCNATSASHRLRIGRHTVEGRIRAVEQLIGCPLHTCLPELAVALRLDELGQVDERRP